MSSHECQQNNTNLIPSSGHSDCMTTDRNSTWKSNLDFFCKCMRLACREQPLLCMSRNTNLPHNGYEDQSSSKSKAPLHLLYAFALASRQTTDAARCATRPSPEARKPRTNGGPKLVASSSGLQVLRAGKFYRHKTCLQRVLRLSTWALRQNEVGPEQAG